MRFVFLWISLWDSGCDYCCDYLLESDTILVLSHSLLTANSLDCDPITNITFAAVDNSRLLERHVLQRERQQ